MRIVTYARVSTESQAERGESLQNQERAFGRWLEQTGHQRVQAYVDTASGKDTVGRAGFTRMIDELPLTKADTIVIDTLDRFTRDLRGGLNLLHDLRGHGVGLLPLDWRRTEPINIDDDRDWEDVAREFLAAEGERRRIRRRIIKAYDGRRARGMPTTNRAPFGLQFVDRHPYYEPTAEHWIVRECERRFLEGETLNALSRWARTMHEGAWQSYYGVRAALKNRAYVRALVRSEATQADLDVALRELSGRRALHSKYEHEFAGVFACGRCVAYGANPDDVRMIGCATVRKGVIYYNVSCGTSVNSHRPYHNDGSFIVSVAKIRPFWEWFIAQLAGVTPQGAAAWERGDATDVVQRRRELERRIAQVDQRMAALAPRRSAAFELHAAQSGAVRRQVEKELEDIDREEATLHAAHEALIGESAALGRPSRDAAELLAAVDLVARQYATPGVSARTKNRLNRALVAFVGGVPIIERDIDSRWHGTVNIRWPQFEELVGKVPHGTSVSRI